MDYGDPVESERLKSGYGGIHRLLNFLLFRVDFGLRLAQKSILRRKDHWPTAVGHDTTSQAS